MKLKTIINYLETIAPSSYQESYDNSGLIVGHPDTKVQGAIICLDSTEAVLDEAIKKKCNLVIAHHPIVFKGLKRLNGSNYVERVVMKAIKHDIAIYAIHTNLDNVYYNGVNAEIAKRIGLINTKILAPKQGIKKLYTFVPATHANKVRTALFKEGAGGVSGFEHRSHSSLGVGTNNGSGSSAEVRLEVAFAADKERNVVHALKKSHPSEKIPYDIIPIEGNNTEVGSGIIGEVEMPIHEKPFLEFVKKTMKAGCIRYTKLSGRKVSKIAVCGGAGGFLLNKAVAQKADIFITADYKYHEFFDADNRIVIADIGHYESEQFTINLLYNIIRNKFRRFAVYSTEVNTNPIKYL